MNLVKKDTKEIPVFADGDIYEISGIQFRLLSHFEKLGKNYYSFLELGLSKFHVVELSTDDLEMLMSNGELIGYEDTADPIYPDLQPGDKAKTDYRYSCIKKFATKLYPDFRWLQNRNVDKSELNSLAEELGMDVKNVRRLLLRYLQDGSTYSSIVDQRIMRPILPGYDPYKGKVRGKKCHGVSSTVLNNYVLFDRYEEAYQSWKKMTQNYTRQSKHKPTIRSVYNSMILRHYADVMDEHQKIPSYARFIRWIRNRVLHGGKIRQNAVGPQDRFNNQRLLVGNSSYGLTYPSELVEIDETEVSLTLRSGRTGEGVGKTGVVYWAVDGLTQCIVGASVNIKENNSYLGVLNLCDSMMMTDQENAQMFGVAYDPGQRIFPGCVIPDGIRTDQGSEYVSKALKENMTGGRASFTLQGIPIEVHIVPPGTGSLKGLVERAFGDLNQRIQDALQSRMGYVSDHHKSQHYKEATLTIDELRQMVYEVIKYMNNRAVPDYPVTPEIDREVPDRTPLALWDYFKAHYGAGIEATNEQVRRAVRFGLMKTDRKFKLSRRQISYGSFLYYDITDDKILTHQAIQLGDSSTDIDIRYDPRLVDVIYRLGEDGIIYEYTLSDKRSNMQSFRGMTWKQFDEFHKGEKTKRYHLKQANALDRAKLQGRLSDIAHSAKQDIPPDNTTPRSTKAAAEEERQALTSYDAQMRARIFGSKVAVSDEPEEDDALPESQPYAISETTESSNRIIDTTDKAAIIAGYGVLM